MLRSRKENRKKMETDFRIRDHGTIWTFEPLTQAAVNWTEDNVDYEFPFGSSGFYADHGPARHLFNAMSAEKFIIELIRPDGSKVISIEV
jgi:hypothetical protein